MGHYLGKNTDGYSMDSCQNAQLIYVCFSGWKEGVLNLFQPLDLDFYRVTTDCNTTSVLKTHVPKTSVLVELSKSCCSIPSPMNLDIIDSRVNLSTLPDRPCLLKSCWHLHQWQLLREDQGSQRQRCWSRSRRGLVPGSTRRGCELKARS